MTVKDEIDKKVDAGRTDLPVPIWAVVVLNLAFVVVGGYIAALGSLHSLAIGGVIVILGAIGMFSIALRRLA